MAVAVVVEVVGVVLDVGVCVGVFVVERKLRCKKRITAIFVRHFQTRKPLSVNTVTVV